MSIITINGRSHGDTGTCSIQELVETIWLTGGWIRHDGDGITRVTLRIRGETGRIDGLRILVPGRVTGLHDRTDVFFDDDYVEYLSLLVDQREVTVRETDRGFVYVDGTREYRLTEITDHEVREHPGCSELLLTFGEPIHADELHTVTFQYRQEGFARPFVQGLSKRREVDIRIYSIFSVWQHADSMAYARELEDETIPVGDVTVWLGLPPGRSPMSLVPRPDRQTAIEIQHPGYRPEEVRTEGYTGIRWNVDLDQSSFRETDLEIHVEYDDASLAWIVAVTSILLTVVGTLVGLVTLVS